MAGRSAFRKLLFILCCVLLGSGATTTFAAANDHGLASVKALAAAKYTKGLLWKIESPGAPPSWLFGTIHSEDARVTALPAPVTQTLDAAVRFTMEAVVDGEALVYMAGAMYFSDGRTLEQVTGKELYAETLKALTARGIPAFGIEKQKPWAVMMALSMPQPKSGEYLDLILQERAARQNKPVTGLETIQEQVAVFDELPLPDQVALLKEAVHGQATFDKEIDEMIRAYLARDIAALAEAGTKHKPDDERLYQAVMDRLLTRRNTRMVERMKPALKEGKAFIAVGAAHLSGEAGLLNLLEKAGYRVSPVY